MASSSSIDVSAISLTSETNPLLNVQTIVVDPAVGSTEVSNASDNKETLRTAFARSFSFDTVAAGDTSKTLIFYLWIPEARAIGNIKLGLLETGGITFTNTTFGISTNGNLSASISPQSYFQGINVNGLSSNNYNISVPNRDLNASEYVYLNISLPETFGLQTGVIKYKWFFDYDGVDSFATTTTTTSS